MIKVETAIDLDHSLGQFSIGDPPPRTHINTPQETTPHGNGLPMRQFARCAKSDPPHPEGKPENCLKCRLRKFLSIMPSATACP